MAHHKNIAIEWQPHAMLSYALFFTIFFGTASAAFNWSLNGVNYSQPTVQLWYEGYWKEVGWINGTLIHCKPEYFDSSDALISSNDALGNVKGIDKARHHRTSPLTEHIVILHLTENWHLEGSLRSISAYRPLAILVAHRRGSSSSTAGALMYSGTDGRERKSINVPVADAPYLAHEDFTELPDGTHLEVQFEKNLWKDVLERTKYQVVIGALLSFWESVIVTFGCFRIYQFYSSDPSSFNVFSIGPMCLILEVISGTIRFIHTVVDPFWVERIYPTQLQNALLTIHFPILFASGILISFFWAETLSKTQLKATPFISKYRTGCIVIVVALFILEVIGTSIRCTTRGIAAQIATWVAVFVYLTVTLVLIVSFSACAYGIFKRIQKTKSRKHAQIRALTLRFGASILGYVLFILFVIGLAISGGRNVVTLIMYDMIYASLNWISTMQVLALKPVHTKYTKQNNAKASGSHSSRSSSRRSDLDRASASSSSTKLTTTTTTTHEHTSSKELKESFEAKEGKEEANSPPRSHPTLDV